MKKILGILLAAALCGSVAFGQVMSSNGFKNTLSTTFGQSIDHVENSDRDPVRYHGFIDTLQVRYNISNFTFEGMLNWGALFDWNKDNSAKFLFTMTNADPLWYVNYYNNNWWTAGQGEAFYLNFLLNLFEGFDIGLGTRLNWKIGEAPSTNGNYWEVDSHAAQGGLTEGDPVTNDVRGFLYYANVYTANYPSTNAAFGVRYQWKDFLEAGIVLPSGMTSGAPSFNAAVNVHPIDMLTISLAYNGILQKEGNLYTSVGLGFDNFDLDVYFAGNFREKSNNGDSNDKWGFGVSSKIIIDAINLSLKPEAGFTFYMNPNYTFAWNAGIRLDLPFADKFKLGTWVSFAGGAKNKNWASIEATKNYGGGFIFNIHPDFTWQITERHSLSYFADYMNKKLANNKFYDSWNMGFVWGYRY